MNMRPKKKRLIVDDTVDRPISAAYPVIDNDLARDNIEIDMPAGDLEDL